MTAPMSSTVLLAWICLFVAFTMGPVVWASEQRPEPAIKGYDPVAYFKLAKAVKGSESFTFRWRDMTWHFSSQEHRDLLASRP